MKTKWIILACIGSALLVGCAFIGPIMSDVEKPDYQILAAQDNIEIRNYEPVIIAQTTVKGQREEAIGDGFRLLADYIFGNNSVKQDIAMTAPVQQSQNQKIAMTAPVQQSAASDDNSWNVSFVMPSEYTMKTLPVPNNNAVKLVNIPATKQVAIRFSGTAANSNIQEHEKKLITFLKANNLTAIGAPTYAFYNPPWTLPFMRRNEIMIEVK